MAEYTELENQEEDGGLRIMVCVDGSNHADAAFDFYVGNFHRPENRVIFIHVANLIMPSNIYTGGMGVMIPSGPSQDDVQKERKRVKELKEKYHEKCVQMGVKKHEFVAFMEGDHGLGATIVDAAKKRSVNTIVCGCRGLGAIRRTILGSVSDYVLHHSHVPTLICPKKSRN
ncbi:universal stress protein YxiE-like [Styela clava]